MFEHSINVIFQCSINIIIWLLLNQFLKHLMNVERSFTVNCLFATFMKYSTGTFSDCFFLMFQEYYF